jgi:hypothetical protein
MINRDLIEHVDRATADMLEGSNPRPSLAAPEPDFHPAGRRSVAGFER